MLEEVLDLLDRDLRHVGVVEHLLVALGELGRGHRDDLLIAAAVVLHHQHADGTNVDVGAGHDGARVGDEHVDRVAVVGQRVRHEPVVAGIAHRGVQEAIDEQRARVLVHLVLDGLAADLHLDDDVDVLGRVLADGNGINAHESSLQPMQRAWPGRMA